MDIQMEPLQKQMLDDAFGALQLAAGENHVHLTQIASGVTRVSPGAVELYALPGEYLSGSAWEERVHPEDRRRCREAMERLASGRSLAYDYACRMRVRSGGYVNTRQSGTLLRGADGQPCLIAGRILRHGAAEHTDPLTVLPNQYALNEALSTLIAEGRSFTALLLGVSQLSRVNEAHGYSCGNRVLQEMAWLIQEAVGARGRVFRVEGSSFLVLSEQLSRDEMAAVYDTIRLRLQRGVRVSGIRHSLQGSGGMIAIQETHTDPATIRACVRAAREESRRRRHGELVDFSGGDRASETLEMLNTIRDRIVEGCRGFALDYQPIVDARTNRVVGAEALVRWEEAPYGRVEPDEFLPALEQDFVFEELGVWILRRAMTDGARMLRIAPDFTLSVNISASQVEDEYFIDTVLEAMRDTGFPAANLSLEITKGCRLLEMERLQTVVRELHSCGIRVGIDDFGAGFESVGFLRRFSADYIKFDRDLVEDIERSEADRETLSHLARCAEARGTQVIVKGVETPEMRDILAGFDIESLQGNYYSQPVRFEELMKLYEAATRNA